MPESEEDPRGGVAAPGAAHAANANPPPGAPVARASTLGDGSAVSDHALAAVLPADSAEAFEAFIRRHVAGGAASPDTVTGYLREARLFRDRFLVPRGLAIGALTEEDVLAYRRELVEAALRPTIGLKLSAPRRLLDAAVRTGRLPANPLAEAQRLVAAISGAAPPEAVGDLDGNDAEERSPLAVRDRALIALFLGHGPRTIELHRANLADLNLAAGELRLRGKTRDRTIYLRADVLALLRELVALYAAAGTLPPEAPLFVNYGRTHTGARLSRRGLRFILDRAFATAGLLAPATSRPRKDGRTRALRRAASGKRAAHDAGLRVPSAHGLRATNLTLDSRRRRRTRAHRRLCGPCRPAHDPARPRPQPTPRAQQCAPHAARLSWPRISQSSARGLRALLARSLI